MIQQIHHRRIIGTLISILIIPKTAVLCGSVPNFESLLSLYQTVANPQMDAILTRSTENITRDLHTTLFQNYILNSDITKLDILFLVDNSYSISHSKFLMGLQFLADLTLLIPRRDFAMRGAGRDRTRISMISFALSSDIRLDIGFNYSQYREMVKRSILNATHQRGMETHLYGGIAWGDDYLNRSSRADATKLVLILTDGQRDDISYTRQLLSKLNQWQTRGIVRMVFPIGTTLNKPIISALSPTDTVTDIFPLRNTHSASRVMTRLKRQLNS